MFRTNSTRSIAMVSLFISVAAAVVYLANGEKVIDGSINLKRHPVYGVAFANFVAHKFHYLDTSPLLTESVNELRECASLCVDHFSCFSFNGALVRDLKKSSCVNCYQAINITIQVILLQARNFTISVLR